MAIQTIPPAPPAGGGVLMKSGVFNRVWSGWFRRLYLTLNANAQNQNALATTVAGLSGGISVTITTSALTGTGTNGSMTFVNGVLVHQVQAT